LGIGKTGVIYGVFHAPTEAALKIGRLNPKWMSTHPATFLSRPSKKLIIQTHSNEKRRHVEEVGATGDNYGCELNNQIQTCL
jgi:hypothetical protein